MKSNYFNLDEFISSDTARRNDIDNKPNEVVKENIMKLMPYMDKIREYLNISIRINSGYRCDELNKKVGGVKNSIHKAGLACDFTFRGINENKMLYVARFVIDNIEEFDQLIIYPNRGFIHINLRTSPRNLLLVSLAKGGYKKLRL